ncbi:MAG: hypothetical protein AAFX78_02600 [Cyanobacteria bacterium J06638_20]
MTKSYEPEHLMLGAGVVIATGFAIGGALALTVGYSAFWAAWH